jgi:RHS repeat-associated protein
VGSQTASYNNLNQLTDLSGQTLGWDANGNLLSDGQRNYSWDAENRLIAISYPGQPGKATAFAYDGLGRMAITTTPAGGGTPVTTRYIWCGSAICQARDAANTPIRSYYAEGEFVPGSPGQAYYYGVDQIGSARRVFASKSSAPAYGYDAWGNSLQATAPLTDFGYAGMFNSAESGLYLTPYRAYDPVAGRWLSRDPVEEGGSPNANLYLYVANSPIILIDPMGLCAGGWLAGFGDYLYNSADALSRIPGDVAGMIREFRDSPLDALNAAGPSLAGIGIRVGGAGKIGPRAGPNFIVGPKGTIYPVPRGAQGPSPSVNRAGNQTGVAFTGGSGGANGQVSTMRIMNPTAAQGRSPGYPNGYENQSRQGVDPYTGRTLPDSQSHFPIE